MQVRILLGAFLVLETSMLQKKVSGVYKITCRDTGKFYIGSSIDIEGRWRKHRWFLCKGIHPNPYLQAVWNKYGLDSLEFCIIETCDESDVLVREQYFLDSLQSWNNSIGFNLSSIAKSGRGPKRLYVVTFPDGKEELVENLNFFCRKYNLNTGNMCQSARGNVRTCKGYKCRYAEVTNESWESSQTRGFKTGRNSFVSWRITRPDGIVIETTNLRQYCLVMNLHDATMCQVASGKRKHHKGFRC
jgi:hypothetical protein